jgi:bacteriocin-like protein
MPSKAVQSEMQQLSDEDLAAVTGGKKNWQILEDPEENAPVVLDPGQDGSSEAGDQT